MPVAIPPGTFDILPYGTRDEWRLSHLWSYVERTIRDTASDYGYVEIRTPIFERTELFQRSVGETSDIVSKEMYTFEDRGGRSMSLRPEGTAPVMRAFIEDKLQGTGSVHKLFYIGPMFRYERSQAGRYRQHHQFGIEAIGHGSPEQDVEVIALLHTLYERLGMKNLKICLNSLGDSTSRQAFRDALVAYLKGFHGDLSDDSKRRLEANPLRILDSKDPKDREIIAGAPSILDFLSDDLKTHFDAVQQLLTVLDIPFEVDPHLVRGLDYYTKTVFEVISGELGAQNSVGGGGRYDGLLKSLGGPDLPTMGFGTGIERIIQTLLKQGAPTPKAPTPVLFVIPLGESSKAPCFQLVQMLRGQGIPSQMDMSGRKLNKVMQYANQLGAQFVVVIGDDEIASGRVGLKEMATGETTEITLEQLVRILRLEIKGEDFLNVWQEVSEPFRTPEEVEFFTKKLEASINNTQKLTRDLHDAMETMKGWL